METHAVGVIFSPLILSPRDLLGEPGTVEVGFEVDTAQSITVVDSENSVFSSSPSFEIPEPPSPDLERGFFDEKSAGSGHQPFIRTETHFDNEVSLSNCCTDIGGGV